MGGHFYFGATESYYFYFLIYSRSMKKGPIIIIALLTALVLFIGGMQYGKRVETADKAIAMILSITPPPYTITIIPHEYITVKNEDCDLSYLLPDYAQDTKDTVTVMCGKDDRKS